MIFVPFAAIGRTVGYLFMGALTMCGMAQEPEKAEPKPCIVKADSEWIFRSGRQTHEIKRELGCNPTRDPKNPKMVIWHKESGGTFSADASFGMISDIQETYR